MAWSFLQFKRRFVIRPPALFVLVITVLLTVPWPLFGQEGSGEEGLIWKSPFVLIQFIWLLVIAIGAPLYSIWAGNQNGKTVNQTERRGLNLPRGSTRTILALLAVGSFLNVMVFGAPVLKEDFDKVLTAFSALTGSVIGFYFGSRVATPLPKEEPKNQTEQE